MAVSPPKPEPDPEPGAPVPRDAIDPDLVKLARKRPQIGLVTAAGVIALCVYYIVHLGPDRRFGGEPEAPRPVALADLADGKIADDSFISVETDPMMSHAIRTATSSGDLGYRVAPARGTGERVWLVLSGDDWQKPNLTSYAGRLRRIGDLRSAHVLDAHARAYPRPTFATAAAVRAGLAASAVQTVAGDRIAVGDADKVAFDVIDPARATVIASFTGPREPTEETPGHGPLGDAGAWIAELAKHGITATPSAVPGEADAILGQARLDVALSVDEVTQKLEAAKLWAARVERVTHHHETTWGALRASPPAGFAASGQTIPDAHVDLVGLFVQRGIPGDAYALLEGEHPQDYWYVRPITIALGIIALLFAWALTRAVRDLMPARAS
ncbi:MAG TPA: hypothetical protein VN253_29535 [Kofleriaceae bacterium]|nr:hypothetical protein [Kofleriaceae bacterium]